MPSSLAMVNLDFLDAKHSIFVAHESAWKREERRLEGGDGILSELAQFKGENAARYDERKGQASYLNFGRIHASTLAGHLARVAPLPDFGALGEVRDRKAISGQPSVAELLFYNVDGIGSDGTQWSAWWTDVEERAIATGHRWILVEMPPAPAGRSQDSPITNADVLAGHRPYLVEYSPLEVPFWDVSHGRLDWAVVRPPATRDPNDRSWTASTVRGYYLLVRQGYEGLGPQFAAGGWWMFDQNKQLLVDESGRELTSTWARTKGQIPLLPLVAGASRGTTERPAFSRSLTMELGQIAISLMNRISERNFDAADAAKSIKFILGAEKEGFNLIVDFLEDGAVVIPVVGVVDTTTGKSTIPSIYDSSAGAVAANVFSTIIESTIAEAHEIMVRQVTSEPGSSGESKRAGFGEATSPLLAGLAQRRETAENSAIYFAELRAGAQRPAGFVTWPKEFEIAPIISKIDAMVERMAKLGALSPTLQAQLVERAAQDDGLWPAKDADQKSTREELVASLKTARAEAVGTAVKTLTDAGAGIGAAAKLAGLSDADELLLVNGSATDRTTPPPAQ